MKNISVAIIPARGGSKGIPKKNLRKINGETLVFKALNFALKTRLFDYVFCSTIPCLALKIAPSYVLPLLLPDPKT